MPFSFVRFRIVRGRRQLRRTPMSSPNSPLSADYRRKVTILFFVVVVVKESIFRTAKRNRWPFPFSDSSFHLAPRISFDFLSNFRCWIRPTTARRRGRRCRRRRGPSPTPRRPTTPSSTSRCVPSSRCSQSICNDDAIYVDRWRRPRWCVEPAPRATRTGASIRAAWRSSSTTRFFCFSVVFFFSCVRRFFWNDVDSTWWTCQKSPSRLECT